MGPGEVFDLMSTLRSRVNGMIGRAIINIVDDATKMQTVQIQTLGNETTDGVERYQNYGLTSSPKAPDANGQGPEAIVLAVGGDRSLEVVIVVADRRFRFRGGAGTGLEEGEVALYDDLGQIVHLTRTGIVVDAPNVKLGAGATKGVNRAGDSALADSVTSDAAFFAWVSAVSGLLSIVTFPTTLTSITGAGSSVVKAVD
jgi:phage baseplate assembly protein V